MTRPLTGMHLSSQQPIPSEITPQWCAHYLPGKNLLTQTRNGEHRFAQDILIMYGSSVLHIVGITLGEIPQGIRFFLIHQGLKEPVSNHRILADHVADRITHLQLLVAHGLHIDQRSHMISRLHTAGQHHIRLQSHNPDARLHTADPESYSSNHRTHFISCFPGWIRCCCSAVPGFRIVHCHIIRIIRIISHFYHY